MTWGGWLCTSMDGAVGITDMHQTKFRGENFFGCGVPQASNVALPRRPSLCTVYGQGRLTPRSDQRKREPLIGGPFCCELRQILYFGSASVT